MKFMLLGLEARGEWERLPQSERDARVGRHQQALQELIAQRGMIPGGKLVLTSVGLGPSADATVLRVKDGKPLTVDGPFAETKEVLAGFDLIDFASRDEAAEFAKKECIHEGHVTEIRPILEMWWAYHGPGKADAMKFMILFHNDERASATRAPEEINRAVQHHQQIGWEYITRKGMARGDMLAWCGARLRPSAKTTTLRVSHGKHLRSDGPFAETKEVLGGFCILDCASKPEAMEWARRYANPGETIEVRPVHSMWSIYHG